MQTQEVSPRAYKESAAFARTVSNLHALATSLSEDPVHSLLLFNYELQMQHFLISDYATCEVGKHTSRKMINHILYTIAMVMQQTHPIERGDRSIMDCITKACELIYDGFNGEALAKDIRKGSELARAMHDTASNIDQTMFLTEFLFCFRA